MCGCVCDGSLRVPKCGECATLRVGRTLFSHTSHLCFPSLSLSKCGLRSVSVGIGVGVGVGVGVSVYVCAPTITATTQIGFAVCFLPQFLVNVLLAIPG